jgi:hypothetical protein
MAWHGLQRSVQVIQKIIDERKIRMGGDIQIWENSTIVLQIQVFLNLHI